jgi:hypothetical protein
MHIIHIRLFPTKCCDHHTITLVTHTPKIVAKILRRGTERKIEAILGEDHFGFRRGKGTRNGTGMLRIISERTVETDTELCVAAQTGRRHLTEPTGPTYCRS